MSKTLPNFCMGGQIKSSWSNPAWVVRWSCVQFVLARNTNFPDEGDLPECRLKCCRQSFVTVLCLISLIFFQATKG